MAHEGKGSPSVPFRLYPVGCCEVRAGLAVCVLAPHRDAWVRGLQRASILLCFGTCGCRCGSPRTRFVARWSSSSVFPSMCPAIYVLYSRTFCPRGGGLYLRLSLCDAYET